jgi:hypothetical protein
MAAIVKPHKITEPLRADDIDDNFDRIFRLLASSVASAGVLPAPSGGTGLGTYSIGDLLAANTTTSLTTIAAVAAGNALISAGIGTIPVWGKISLSHLSALTTKGDLLGHTGAAHARIPVGTDGYVLKARASDPNGVAWEEGTSAHELLDSPVHTDTITGSPIRGDLVAALSPAEDGPYWIDGAVLSELDNGNNYGEEAYWLDGEATGGIGFSADAGSKWQRFPVGPAGTSLQSNGLTLLWGSTTPTAPRVKVGLSANFDLDSGAVGPYTPGGTVVPLDELIFDSHGFWNPTVNPERFTVPTGLGGVYIIAGQIGYDVIASGRRAAWIFKNGERRGIAENAGDDSGLGMSFTVVTFLELQAGDYIELVARQDSGGTVAVLGTANAEFSHLQMARISL